MPTHARRAFPCFDEPSFRAKFKLTIRRHKSFSTSLFNTQIEKSVKEGDWFIDYFKETANLPTYLIAYSIGNFNQSIVTSTQGNKCEMTARPQAINANQLRFALNQLVLIVDFYEKFFETLYPFDKISNSIKYAPYTLYRILIVNFTVSFLVRKRDLFISLLGKKIFY